MYTQYSFQPEFKVRWKGFLSHFSGLPPDYTPTEENCGKMNLPDAI